MTIHSFFNCLSRGKNDVSRASTFTGSFNKARVRGRAAEKKPSAAEGDNGVDELEGARNREDGAGLTGEAGAIDLRIKTTLNTPEGGGSRRIDLIVQAGGESNIPSTKNVPQAGKANFIMVNSVFSFHNGQGFRDFGNSELQV